jgi:hypothetical protein
LFRTLVNKKTNHRLSKEAHACSPDTGEDKLREENLNSRPAWATLGDPASKKGEGEVKKKQAGDAGQWVQFPPAEKE